MDEKNQMALAANEAGNEHDADIVLLNAPMMPGLEQRLRDLLNGRQRLRKNVIVVLVTEGGMADTSYRVARLLQTQYVSVSICIAGWCKSAGTLLAIGAHELIIGDTGEMGPLDVQIVERDEIGNRTSGLILESAIDSLQTASFSLFEKFMMQIKARSANTITFRTAADLAAQMTVGMMAPIFQQIDPTRMGDDARAQRIGSDYAIRLNHFAQNLRSAEALEMLLKGYPSHSFVIDAAEASNLFSKVKPLDGKLKEVIDFIGRHAVVPADSEDGWLVIVNEDCDVEQPANDQDEEDGNALAPAIHAVRRARTPPAE